jgi:hypothetical protein
MMMYHNIGIIFTSFGGGGGGVKSEDLLNEKVLLWGWRVNECDGCIGFEDVHAKCQRKSRLHILREFASWFMSYK